MAAIELEGDTLGQKHRSFNALVKAAAADESYELRQISYNDSDIQNLMRIDVACIRRKAEYILEVLKCEDMLYVSRALKGGTWLITDEQYAHIINPEYLNQQLFPRMTTKAKNKMLTSIRYNLKDSTRAEAFFNYYIGNISIAQRWQRHCSLDFIEDTVVKHVELFPRMTTKAKNKMVASIRYNLKDSTRAEAFFKYNIDNMSIAQHWLRHCSLDFIEDIVAKHADEISCRCSAMKHVCRKFPKVLKSYLRSHTRERDSHSLHKYLLKAEQDDVIDIMDSIYSGNQKVPNFRRRFTRSLMKQYPDIIIENFEKYYNGIHLATFVKHMKKEDLETFLVEHIQRVSMKTFCRYENFKYFLRYMPKPQRIRLIKTILSGKENDYLISESDLINIKDSLGFHAYEFLDFDEAFSELKKILAVESSQFHRKSILSILICNTRGNPQDVKVLLEYYEIQHKDDSFVDKVQFLAKLLPPSSIHEYGDSIWSIINEIFINMNLNKDTNVDAFKYVESVIVHKILHNEQIPEIFVKKTNFKSFLDFRNQLNASEQQKVLDYVFNSCFKKKYKKDIVDEAEMRIMVGLIRNVLILLKDWNKGPDDYPCIYDNIRNIINLKNDNSWDTDLCSLYRANKLFWKHLLEESLLLCPSDETFVNALKHNPNLLSCYRDKYTIVATVPLKKSLEKLRIYWPKCTVQQWVETYKDHLTKSNPTGHTAIVKNLFILLPRQEAMSMLVQKYAPELTQSESINDYTLALGQNIARYLHLIRPLIDEKALLMYAKTEYLPYLIPAFDAVLRNKSSIEFWNIILSLLSIDPLHRYVARLVLSLLNTNIPEGYTVSVKTQLIKILQKLLYQEKTTSIELDIWNLFSKVFDDLPSKEKQRLAHSCLNRICEMSEMNKVVISKLFMKMYSFLTTHYSKKTSDQVVLNSAIFFFDRVEPEVEDVVIKIVSEQMIQPNYGDGEEILAIYLLNCNCEKMQIEKYEKILIPIMDHYFACWQNYEVSRGCSPYFEKHRLYRILGTLADTCFRSITTFNSIVPVKLFTCIRDKLENTLNFEEDLHIIMICNLNVIFMEILNDHLKIDADQIFVEISEEKWNRVCGGFVNYFAQASLKYLMPIIKEFSSFHVIVSRVCMEVFSNFNVDNNFKLLFVKYLLNNVNDPIIYFVAIDILRHLRFNHTEEESPLRLVNKELIEIIRSHPSIDIRSYFHHYEDILVVK